MVAAEIAGTVEGDVLAVALTVPTFFVGLFSAMPQYVSLRALGSQVSVRAWVQRNRLIWFAGALIVALVSAGVSAAMIVSELLEVSDAERNRAIAYSGALSFGVYCAMVSSVPVSWAISTGRARSVLYHQITLSLGVLVGGLLLWINHDRNALQVVISRIVASGVAAVLISLSFRSANGLKLLFRPESGQLDPSPISHAFTGPKRRLLAGALAANGVSLILPLAERTVVSGSDLPLGSLSVLFFSQGLALSLGNAVGAGRTHRISARLRAVAGADELALAALRAARRTLLEMGAVVGAVEALCWGLWLSGIAEGVLGESLARILPVSAIYLVSAPFAVSGTVLGRWFQLDRRLGVAVGISAGAASAYIACLVWMVDAGMRLEWVAAGYAGYWPLTWLLLYAFVAQSRRVRSRSVA